MSEIKSVNLLNKISTEEMSISPSGKTSSINIGIVDKASISENEKKEMLLLGMNPCNQDDIKKYRSMSSEKKNELLNSSLEIVDKGETVSKKSDLIDDIANKFDNYAKSNTDNWNEKSDVQKVKFVIESDLKSQYGEKWNTMSNEDKKNAVSTYVGDGMKKYVPGWENMNKKEKLDKMSEIATLYAISKSQQKDFFELLKIKENSPDEFAEIEKNYHDKGHVNIDFAEIGRESKENLKAQYIKDSTAHNEALLKYCGGEKPNESEYAIKEYEFLKSSDLKSLNHVQKRLLKDYEQVEDLISRDGIKNLELGDKNLSNILPEEELKGLNLSKDDNGEINLYNIKNRKILSQAIVKKVLSSKTSDEIKNNLKGLNISSLKEVMQSLGEAEPSEEFLAAYKELTNQDFTTTVFHNSDITNNASKRTKSWQNFDSKEVLPNMDKWTEKLGLKDSQMAKELQFAMTSAYEKPYATQAQVTAGELGKEEYVEAGNKGIAEREDALDVFEAVNEAYANSNTISDAIKKFYAQNSIEVLKSPEARQAQADNLGNYNIDAFDKGVQTGLTNVEANSASSTTSSNFIDLANNDLTLNNGNDSNTINYENTDSLTTVQSFKEKILAMKSADNISEFIKQFKTLDSNQQNEFLSTIPIKDLPIKVCEHFPALVQRFVNEGSGLEVINNCNMNTGNLAIKCMMSNSKARKELAAVRPERLSKFSYDKLVNDGTIQQKNSHKRFEWSKA